eukprot:gene25905-34498_t
MGDSLREVSLSGIRTMIERDNLLFLGDGSEKNPYLPETFDPSELAKRNAKTNNAYGDKLVIAIDTQSSSKEKTSTALVPMKAGIDQKMITNKGYGDTSSALIVPTAGGALPLPAPNSNALVKVPDPNKKFGRVSVPKPQWHPSWELSAVVSGHLGWVRSIAFDASNSWFVTGSADRTIKIWDLAKCCIGAEGGLKLTLTGHINAIRGLAVSPRHPYLFSAGEDKMVKCWDMEYNKVIRHYHGHLSAVFSLSLHPILDILITGGRDSVARVWDMRTKHQIHVLGGHNSAVSSLISSGVDPQVITGSHDSTIKLWDLAAGKAMSTLTHHKKAVRSLIAHPKEMTFASGAVDNIKKWQCRDGKFLKNMSGQNSPINALAVNEDGVLVSGGDNGSINFWDYETGYCFQNSNTIVQPGSLDAEAGIYAAAFDLSGSRLITCEADKSLKIWKENPLANEEMEPIDMAGWTKQCLALKRY